MPARQPSEALWVTIVAVLLGAPAMTTLPVLTGAQGLALWYLPAALFLIAISWREMFRQSTTEVVQQPLTG